MPKAAMVVVINDENEVLMLWRHRFIIDRWVRELPGGYVDPGEEPARCAMREVEEEPGWRPRRVDPPVSPQPSVGTRECKNLICFSESADYLGEPTDVNEAEKIGWIPLGAVRQLIDEGEIAGAASQVGQLYVLASRPR